MEPNRATSSAIWIGVVGAVLLVIGLGLFLSVFVSFGNSITNSSPFPNSGPLNGRMLSPGGPPSLPIGRAAAGALMAGLGGVMLKVALGVGLVGNARSITGWVKSVTNTAPSQTPAQSNTTVKVRCPQCKSLNNENARFCSSCGHELT